MRMKSNMGITGGSKQSPNRQMRLSRRPAAIAAAAALVVFPCWAAGPRAKASRASGLRTGRAAQASQPAAQDLTVLEYSLPSPNSGPYGLAEGPDGNMWIVEQTANKIARMTPDGSSFTEYPIPTPSSRSWGMTLGPDGNLWFAEGDGNKIAKFSAPATASGAISITEYPVPTPGATPFLLTPGPDGNIWFTETLVDKIGKITPSGAVTEFSLPTQPAYPYGITTGSDGNIWFTEYVSNKIGRVTPAGVFTEFQVPTATSFPFGIASAPTGELWFTEQAAGQIAAITTSGAITEFPTESSKSGPGGIVSLPVAGAQRTAVHSSGSHGTATLNEAAADDNLDNEKQDHSFAVVEVDGKKVRLFWGGIPPAGNRPGLCHQPAEGLALVPGDFLGFTLDVRCPEGPCTCSLYAYSKDDKELARPRPPEYHPISGGDTGSQIIEEYACFCVNGGGAAQIAKKATRVGPDDSSPAFAYDPLDVSIPTVDSGAYVIAAGPGGRYFTEMNANKVGRIVRSITINPLYQQISVGGQAVLTLKDLAVQGPVSLTAVVQNADETAAGSSLTAALNPASLGQGGSATLTVSAAPNAAPGDYGVGVLASSADGLRVVGAEFTVVAPDFAIGFDSPTVTAQAGTKARVSVNVTRTGGFTGNVTVTPPAAANGIRPKPPDPVTAASTDTSVLFKFKIGGGVTPGQYPLTFTAQDDSGRTRTATVMLVVQ